LVKEAIYEAIHDSFSGPDDASSSSVQSDSEDSTFQRPAYKNTSAQKHKQEQYKLLQVTSS
jgi:hypothetical protein